MLLRSVPDEKHRVTRQELSGSCTRLNDANNMKQPWQRYAPLTLLLALILFPFGWLTVLSPQADAIGNIFFPDETAHAIGHSLIFSALGVALLVGFPALRRRPVRYLALVLAVAVGQELFQLAYKGRGVVLNDLTDIATDMVAAGLVLALWDSWRIADSREPRADSR